MSLFKLIRDVAAKRIDAATTNEHKATLTPVPLNMHQGSVVTIPELDLALAEADGSIVPKVELSQRIISVGTQTVFGTRVYNCYLADGESFLRVVALGNEAAEVSLYVSRDEIIPHSKEDWEFWLGRWNTTDAGTKLTEPGLIGWQQFQIDGPPAIVYNRAWNPSDIGIEPVSYTETIVELDGGIHKVQHEIMEYHRMLGNGDSPTRESLLVGMASCGTDASINIFVGVPLSIRDLKVLAPN